MANFEAGNQAVDTGCEHRNTAYNSKNNCN